MILKKNLFLELGKKQEEEIKADEIQKKKLHLFITDEKLFIKKFLFPNVKKENIYFLVKNELHFSVGNITNILFDYKVVTKFKNNIEVLVFYVNSQKINIIKKLNAINNIKEIKIIQFEVLKYYRKVIKVKNFILIFHFNNTSYFLGIKNNNMVANLLVEDFELENHSFTQYFNDFVSENFIAEGSAIYLSNMEVMSEKIGLQKTLCFNNLEKFNKEKLLKFYKWGR